MTGSLADAATAAASGAYAPYSRYRVGAAGRTRSGRVLTAVNVENASYGLSICAETALCCRLVADGDGPGDLVEVEIRSPEGEPLAPCGRCRQVMLEFGGPDLVVNGLPLSDLLPHAWGPDDLRPEH